VISDSVADDLVSIDPQLRLLPVGPRNRRRRLKRSPTAQLKRITKMKTVTCDRAGQHEPVPHYRDRLAPLLRRLRTYDALRQKLQEEGGRIRDVKRITHLLSEAVEIEDHDNTRRVSLIGQNQLRRVLSAVGRGQLHLQVRRLDCGMPVYYLCRTRRDYWHEYSLVVEDMYRSPGYPFGDGRFVRLMSLSHERYYLRLSPFRGAAGDLLAGGTDPTRRELDEFLYRVGRHIFQTAWHDDQRVGILAARHFDLPTFSRAIELLYLCLSGELCEVRSVIDDDMLRFFEHVYPQPSLHRFLERLTEMDGQTLNTLPRRALKLYKNLAAAFSRFLQVQVTRNGPTKVPLYKLIFSNMARLDSIAGELEDNDQVHAAAQTLEQSAQRTVDQIIEPGSEEGPLTGIFSFFSKKSTS
jgi:hypothetical protein